jgi:hypothetical protein
MKPVQQGNLQQITATIPTITRLHDTRHGWRQEPKTFSGFIKARERALEKKKQKSTRGKKPRRGRGQ